jgi:glycosyltransferase involved in cell wall biosynthesis
MRIAHLTTDWKPSGGVSTYLRQLAPAQVAAGHEVLVVHGGEPASEPALPGLTLVAVPGAFHHFNSAAHASFVAPVHTALERFSPDVVHVQASDNFDVEDHLRAHFPIVKTMHNLWFCPAGTKYHAATAKVCGYATGIGCVPRQALMRCTTSRRPSVWWANYRLATRSIEHHRHHAHLIVASPFMRDQAVASGCESGRVTVVPFFTPIPASVEPVSTMRVLYAGRVAREKGPDLMVDALSRCAGDWRGVIVGDGIDTAYLRRRVDLLGLSDRVEFHGWLDAEALADQYRRAAVVVVPSRLPEPFGLTGIEAMAHGRPVVAFRTGGIPSWLEDGVGGWLAAPGDVDDFAHQISRLLTQSDEARAVAERGRARVLREFSAAAHLERLHAVYDEVRVH